MDGSGGVVAGSNPPRPTHRTVQVVVDAAGRGSIVVNGVDMSNVVNGVQITSKVSDTTRATLSIVAPVVEFDGVAAIEILGKTRDALIALGWTPPEVDAESRRNG